MTTTLSFKPGDPRTIWLLKLDLPPQDLGPFQDATSRPSPLQAALGLNTLDANGTEVFDPADLDGLPLSSYLAEAHGMDPVQVAEMAPQLDALTGPLLLVFSSGFGDTATTMTPQAPLRHIATFTQTASLALSPPLTAQSTDGSATPAATPPKSDARIGGMVATIALLLMFAFMASFIWIGS